MSKSETTPPRTKADANVYDMIEWLDWQIPKVIKSSSENYWLKQIREFLKEVADGP